MKTLILFTLAVFTLSAQVPRYSATTGDVSLSGSGTALTIQQPSSNPSTIALESAVIYCSAACSVTQSQNGTAATSTAGTALAIPPNGQPALSTVWTASNAGSGTAVGGIFHIQAGSTGVLDLSKVVIPKGGTTANYTVTIGSMTGTVNITLYWSETK